MVRYSRNNKDIECYIMKQSLHLRSFNIFSQSLIRIQPVWKNTSKKAMKKNKIITSNASLVRYGETVNP